MKKGTLKRFAAALMTCAMMVGLFGTSVMAEDATPVESVTLTKTVKAEEDVLMPNAEFTFAIANGTAVAKDVIYAGVEGGVTFADADDTVSFAPGDDNTESLSLVFNAEVFSKPGVYRYEVTETTGSYDGMTYSTVTYYVDLYVVNGANEFVVDDVVVTNTVTGKKTEVLAFENTYATNNLTLKKVIAGNQADMKEKYNFTVTINGADGEKYATSYMNDGEKVILQTGVPYTFTLGHNEEFVIYGLSGTDNYTIVEDNAHLADGYTTTVEGDTFNEVAEGENTLKVSGTTTADKAITYTNTKEVATPTGVILTFAPYIAMIVLAAAAFVIMRRRRVEF